MPPIILEACGSDGKHGIDGKSYKKSQSKPGAKGVNGGNATDPENGDDGGKIELSLEKTRPDCFSLNAQITDSTGKTRSLKQESIPLPGENVIKINVAGGSGGNGGNGGDGSKGGNGIPGIDGLNAIHGKDGGDGGKGSSGANGGNGGKIIITIKEADINLLKLISNIKCSKGMGGEKGKHGNPGHGGRGVVADKEAIKFSMKGGKRYLDHKLPKGHDSKTGKSGITPSLPLLDGKDGKDGSIVINVTHTDGSQTTYNSIYDLRVKALQFYSDTNSNSIFEPGDTVSLMNVIVENVGHVPFAITETSTCVKMIAYDPLLSPLNSIGMSPMILSKGSLQSVPGSIRFDINEKDFLISNLPLQYEVPYSCLVYNNDVGMGFQPLQERLIISYPVKIHKDIQFSHSIPVGEKSAIKISVINDSPNELGTKSLGGRYVSVRFMACSETFDCSKLSIRMDTDDEFKSLANDCDFELDLVKGTDVQTLNFHIMTSPETASGEKFVLKCQMVLESLKRKGTMNVIQSIDLNLSTGIGYCRKRAQSVLLVTNDLTTSHEYREWDKLLQSFGFNYAIFDVSHYKIFSLTKTIPAVSGSPSSNLLQEFFDDRSDAGGIIIILNNVNSFGHRAVEILDTKDLVAFKKRKGIIMLILDEGGESATNMFDLSLPVDKLDGACDPSSIEDKLETTYELGKYQWLRLYSYFDFTFKRAQKMTETIQNQVTNYCPREKPYIASFLVDKGDCFIIIIPTLQGICGGRIVHIPCYSENVRAESFSMGAMRSCLLACSTSKLKIERLYALPGIPNIKEDVSNPEKKEKSNEFTTDLASEYGTISFSLFYDIVEDMVGEWNEPVTIIRSFNLPILQGVLKFLIDNQQGLPEGFLVDFAGSLQGFFDFLASFLQRWFSKRSRYVKFQRIIRGFWTQISGTGHDRHNIWKNLEAARIAMHKEIKESHDKSKDCSSKSAFLLKFIWQRSNPETALGFQPINMSLLSGKRGIIETDIQYYELVDRKDAARKRRKAIWRTLKKQLQDIDVEMPQSYLDGMATSINTLNSFSSINLLTSNDNLPIGSSTDQLIK